MKKPTDSERIRRFFAGFSYYKRFLEKQCSADGVAISDRHINVARVVAQFNIHRRTVLVSLEKHREIILSRVQLRHVTQQGRAVDGWPLLFVVEEVIVHRLSDAITGKAPVIGEKRTEPVNGKVRRKNVVEVVVDIASLKIVPHLIPQKYRKCSTKFKILPGLGVEPISA